MGEDRSESVLIDRIGHRGDGIGENRYGPVRVPFALPGEELIVERNRPGDIQARLIRITKASNERVKPPCRYFGAELPVSCGGCTLQMMSLEANRDLKRRFVADALAGQGIDVDVDATVGAAPGERRRAVLSASKTKAGILLGFHQRRSNHIVDIDTCPVLLPQISDRLCNLRALLEELDLHGGAARLTVIATGSGLDVDIAPDGKRTSFGSLSEAHRHSRIVSLCQQSRIARLTIQGELAVKLTDPTLNISGVTIVPPPGAFTQPVTATEAAMIRLVDCHLSGCGAVIDLFSGFGTFTLARAKHSRVHAVEIDRSALRALEHAIRRSDGLKRVTTERRDILRFPVGSAELAGFCGIVFDPPRSGARAQVKEIAGSAISRVAAVSCNPATFARDCRVLLDGGFKLLKVVPIDQFVYSAETEIVGLFVR